MKRFWTEVTVADGEVRLDGRPVRTPGRAPLRVPSAALTEAIAEEWRAVGEEIDPRVMRMTGLANAAIDRIDADRAPFVAGLGAYGENDLLCYRADTPQPLVDRQAAAWDPLLDWARHRYDIHFTPIAGVMHKPQPPLTITRLAEAIAAHGPFELAALSQVIGLTGTLVGALALAEGAVDADTLWAAAHVDESWQAEQWGVDALAEATQAMRRADYDAAVCFLTLLGPRSDPRGA